MLCILLLLNVPPLYEEPLKRTCKHIALSDPPIRLICTIFPLGLSKVLPMLVWRVSLRTFIGRLNY